LRVAIERTLKTYKNRELWKKVMANAFKSDFSWKKAVEKYIKLYQKALDKPKGFV
jgi:starch synthase